MNESSNGTLTYAMYYSYAASSGTALALSLSGAWGERLPSASHSRIPTGRESGPMCRSDPIGKGAYAESKPTACSFFVFDDVGSWEDSRYRNFQTIDGFLPGSYRVIGGGEY